MEDYVFVLDYLPQGRIEERAFKRTPLALAIGEDEFKLFELIPKINVTLRVGERVYIGKDLVKRDKIEHVKRRIAFDELTNAAKGEAEFVVEDIVKAQENKFIKFFNTAGPITTRYHMLELLPGLGKKTMWSTIEEREKEKFKNFSDLENRVKTIHHPEKLITKRIMMELEQRDIKYKIFVAK